MNKIELCKQWIEQFVIKLRLCPFAHYSYNDGTIAYAECGSSLYSGRLSDVCEMIRKMDEVGASVISNAFVIFDNSIGFRDLLSLQDELISWIDSEGYADVYQSVAFHPEFQFALSGVDDHGNFVNRSPHPMIHILRVAEVSRAIDNTADAHAIPNRNKEMLEKLQIQSIEEIFTAAFVDRATTLLGHD